MCVWGLYISKTEKAEAIETVQKNFLGISHSCSFTRGVSSRLTYCSYFRCYKRFDLELHKNIRMEAEVSSTLIETESNGVTGMAIFPLLQLPDLVRHKILNHISLKDILSFRQVCREANAWTMEYPGLKKRLKSVYLYLLDSKSFISFIELGSALPFTSFFLKFDPFNMSGNEEVKSFVNKFGSAVEYLKVDDMNWCETEDEFRFYSSFKNIKTLEITQASDGSFFHWPTCDEVLEDGRRSCDLCSRSAFHSRIKNMRIPHGLQESLENLIVEMSVNSFYPYDVLPVLKRLKYLKIGRIQKNAHPETLNNKEILCEQMKRLSQYIFQRPECPTLQKVVLTLTLDMFFDYYKFDGIDEDVILNFLRAIGMENVRMVAMNTAIYELLERFSRILNSGNNNSLAQQIHKNIFSSINRFEGISPRLMTTEMPNLKRLLFSNDDNGNDNSSSMFRNCILSNWSSDMNQRESLVVAWPKLELIVGSLKDCSGRQSVDDQAAFLREFLLTRTKACQKVTRVSFTVEVPIELSPDHFTMNFPNLDYLHLEIVSFNKSDYSRLFFILGNDTRIRTLELETATLLDDETFYGPGVITGATKTPPPCYFATMKYLKRFSLRHPWVRQELEIGHEISDKMIDILSSMSLSSLVITKVLEKVTDEGMRRLFEGKFGQNVQCISVKIKQISSSLDLTNEVSSEEFMEDKVFCTFKQLQSNKELVIKKKIQKSIAHFELETK